MARKFVYWLGVGAVAGAAAWAVWLSWRATSAADSESTTDRIRILVGLTALAVLPWAGRKRGWFGPVRDSVTARLVRVAGCAAMCGLGIVLVRTDSHTGGTGIGTGEFSWAREIGGLVLLGTTLAAPQIVKLRWPRLEAGTLWSLAGLAGVVVWATMPIQLLAIAYVAGILAATSRWSPVTDRSLAVGVVTGLAAGLVADGLASIIGDIALVLPFLVAAGSFLFAIPAGIAAAAKLRGRDNPEELLRARIRQGMLAGTASGAAGGLLLTLFFVGFGLMMVLGPMIGLVGGAAGGALAADPRKSPRDGSRAAGIFVLARNPQASR